MNSLLIGDLLFLVSDLVRCTNEPNVSIPQLANLLIERSQNTNWTVVFKALITVHHMLCYGNEVKTNPSGICNAEQDPGVAQVALSISDFLKAIRRAFFPFATR